MAHHAKHARTPAASSTRARALPLLGLAAAGLGVVTAPAAHAAPTPHAADVAAPTPADVAAQHLAVQELSEVQLYPLAGTPLDLLSNNLRVPVGGTEVSTFPVTAPLRDGLPLGEVPVVGQLLP